jgi:FHA domain
METRTNTQICPNCGHENPAKTDVCKKCQHDFAAAQQDSTATDRDSTNRLDKTSAIPNLDELGLLDDTHYSESEFAESDVQTLSIEGIHEEDSPMSEGAVRLQGNLILTERETGKKFVITPENLKEAVIGRKNQQTGFSPAIDLSPFEAHKYGVSRRHATISYRDNWLILIDHNSTNGTFLNGHRLVPEQPRVIRDKDTIRIGGIILHVAYGQAE